MTVTIDCRDIRTNEEFHKAFSSQLRLPGFYGENLDALHDCLTSLPQKTTINLLHTESLIHNLGPYGRAAINAIAHAERENAGWLQVNMM
ncbi:MAG: barstar family protein [Oscillospiraceae bacterium]|nr:barstar family protein [Oscillospiraceae bacterium]